MKLRITRGAQHPDQVVEAAVRTAERWAPRPEVGVLARTVLSDYAPRVRDTSGRWVPDALARWARQTTFYREPPPPDGPGEIVTSPLITIAVNGGDCDDIAAAVAAMAASVGFRAWIGRLYTSRDYASAHILVAVSPSWWPGDPGEPVIVDPELPGPLSWNAVTGVRWAPIVPSAYSDRWPSTNNESRRENSVASPLSQALDPHPFLVRSGRGPRRPPRALSARRLGR